MSIKKVLRRSILVLCALMGGISVWVLISDPATFRPPPPLPDSSIGLLPSVYLVPRSASAQAEPLVPEEALAHLGVTPATSQEQLTRVIDTYPHIATIYLHPDVVAAIDPAWLQAQYQQGMVIVALNTPLSVLGGKVGVRPTVPDFRTERLARFPPGYLYFSLVHAYSSQLQGLSQSGEITFFAPNFETVARTANHDAQEIAQLKGGSTVPERIAGSDMTPSEKFRAFFAWMRNGCLWRACSPPPE